MAAEKILKVKVKETNVNDLPEPLQAPGKDRMFEVLLQTEKETTYPNGRFLLKTPKGQGGYCLDSTEESWWVPRESCEVIEKEGGTVVKEVPAPKKEEVAAASKPVETVVERVVERITYVDKVVEREAPTKAEETKAEDRTNMSMKQKIKSDAYEAAYIVAGTQITNAVKAAVMKMVEGQLRNQYGKKQSKINQGLEGFKAFLDTPFGNAVIQSALGYALEITPKLKDDVRVQKLAQGMRVQGFVVAGNAAVDALMVYVGPAVMGALSSLPSLPELSTEDKHVEQKEEITLSAGSSKSAAA